MTTYAHHRRAHFEYEILDTIEAGLVLLGTEVKSIRTGHVKLDGGHIIVRGGEAYLVGVTIPAFQPINTEKSYDPDRPRKLLLTAKELNKLNLETEKQGLTAIPISLYNKSRHLKLAVAIARGKKKGDKREALKEREVKRDIDRTLKMQ
jgi:SsrA-binding protein